MRTALLLSALLGARASAAAPDPAGMMRSLMPPGFAPVALEDPVVVPDPVPALMTAPLDAGDQTVALAPLLDRHLSTTDSFKGAGGVTLISGTLDLAGNGYLAVTPPGGVSRFIKIERGMSGTWSDGVDTYQVSLSVNIFRPRLANFIVLRDITADRVVWENRINDLFRLTYRAGEPVVLAGRPYRLFYSQRPTVGLCFIYDDTSAGGHDYKFYMVPLNQIDGAAPTSYKMFGDDVVKLHASPDLSTLHISR
jgi:hypothetical protein